ncbi:hypothetical protein HYH03_003434 [Edaphochlamys debaryana]|uniref:Peroxisomal membrane protein PEX16 n=1 Tax=Edaphochlamys debaryana TaxID=47281 RepID=A0A835YJA3_9CHLO|nr:hypothetical protein HYH03_003434 [Edaphochlamys debaryana]|eukprot:KAG2498694.1 hypothetical protein HYH03_003434 [Edaphochlamys debaryana]
MLTAYKDWVKKHPGWVSNLDWLLLFTVWNPGRATGGGSEATYEAYHAGVGLLSLWHQYILEEGSLPTPRPPQYLWLDAIEHVETLIELRGMYLESAGRMNRYGPLLAVEVAKAVLKMAAWSRYSGHMFLRRPSADDLHQFESELGLQDILASLDRLRSKYAGPWDPVLDGSRAPSRSVSPCASAPAVTDARPSCARDASASCGAGGGGSSCPAEAGTAGSAVMSAAAYGLRQYVGETFGWLQGLVPACRLGAGGSSSGGGSGADGCSRGGGGGGGGADEERLRSCAAAGASPRCCGDSAAAATPAGPPPLVWEWPELRPSGQGATAGGSQAQPSASGSGPGGARAGAGAGAGVAGFGVGGGFGAPLRVLREQRARAAAAADEDPVVHMGRNLLWLAELLYIWRPVVYVSMLKRYGRKSWRPWLVSLGMDLLSGHFQRRGRQHLAEAAARAAARAAAAEAQGLAASAAAAGGAAAAADAAGPTEAPAGPAAAAGAKAGPAAHRGPGGGGGGGSGGGGTSLLSLALARSLAAPGVTAGEERELYDRRRKLVLYALRSPFLEATTLSWLSGLRNATRRVPLLGLATDYAYGLAETFTAYYTYTSGSN